MSKLLQALLSGMFITFLLDFSIFLGIKLNYIDFYEIDVYYNILFADNQDIFLYSAFTLFLGYLVVYLDKTKITLITLSVLFLLSFSTLFHQVGYSAGEMLFMQKNVILKNSRHKFIGDIYYDGRDVITFYDYELKKIILLNKKELIQ